MVSIKYLRPFVLLFLCFLLFFFNVKGQKVVDIPVVKKGAVVEKLAGGFSFTEGPAADKDGNVYFTDQPNDRIMKWDINGKLTTFLQPSGRSNGMYFDSKGFLWTCADERNELWRIGPDKTREIITGKFNALPFNGPNDLWISPTDGIYFTDPFYRRSWWNHTEMPQDKQCVYFLSPENKSVVRVDDKMVRPNGIIGTPDGKILYVADIGDNKTWSFTINSDGSLSNKSLFCNMGSDGMTIDNEGNLFLTGDGVTIIDKTGRKMGHIPVPEKWTANVCFGGKDRKSLFITASESLYMIRMKTKGVY
jgi:gluconolactonase